MNRCLAGSSKLSLSLTLAFPLRSNSCYAKSIFPWIRWISSFWSTIFLTSYWHLKEIVRWWKFKVLTFCTLSPIDKAFCNPFQSLYLSTVFQHLRIYLPKEVTLNTGECSYEKYTCKQSRVKIFLLGVLAVQPSLICDPLCDVNADCKNFTGKPECMCKAGFDGDGITCTG